MPTVFANHCGSRSTASQLRSEALTSLNSPDALLGQRLVTDQELLVLAREDVIGDSGCMLARGSAHYLP